MAYTLEQLSKIISYTDSPAKTSNVSRLQTPPPLGNVSKEFSVSIGQEVLDAVNSDFLKARNSAGGELSFGQMTKELLKSLEIHDKALSQELVELLDKNKGRYMLNMSGIVRILGRLREKGVFLNERATNSKLGEYSLLVKMVRESEQIGEQDFSNLRSFFTEEELTRIPETNVIYVNEDSWSGVAGFPRLI